MGFSIVIHSQCSRQRTCILGEDNTHSTRRWLNNMVDFINFLWYFAEGRVKVNYDRLTALYLCLWCHLHSLPLHYKQRRTRHVPFAYAYVLASSLPCVFAVSFFCCVTSVDILSKKPRQRIEKMLSGISMQWKIDWCVAYPAFIFVLCISVTIHVPFLKSSGTRQQPAAPAAIAQEAPEGTYLFPVTEQNKEQPPTVNLVLNLRLVMDGGNNLTN